MIIISNGINCTDIKSAINKNDFKFINEKIKIGALYGVSYTDLNLNCFNYDEACSFFESVYSKQKITIGPLSINSSNPEIIVNVLDKIPGKHIINHLSCGSSSMKKILPIVEQYKTKVIALCTDDSDMPESLEQRLKFADKLLNSLVQKGLSHDDIFVDPFVRPVGTGSQHGIIILETIGKLRELFPDTHITCNLNNISMGLPERKLMNKCFLVSAMTMGLDSVIINHLDKELMSHIYASEAMLGIDNFCMDYMMKYREGLLSV